MSIKLRNGYRLESSLSPFMLTRTLNDTFDEVRETAFYKAMAELVLNLRRATDHDDKEVRMNFVTNGQIDLTRLLFEGSSDNSNARRILHALQERLQRDNARRCPGLDLTLRICFMVDPSNGNDIYATVYTENKYYIERWESIVGVVPFPYWNDIEEPVGMTRKEWKARGRKWDEVTAGGRPSYAALTWDLDMFPVRTYTLDEDRLENEIIKEIARLEASEAWLKGKFGDDLSGLFGNDNGS